MEFDIHEIPFSCSGAYLAFSCVPEEESRYEDRVALRSLYGEFDNQEYYAFILQNESGVPMDYRTVATPGELLLQSGEREIRMCFEGSDTVHLKGNTALQVAKTKADGFSRVIGYGEKRLEFAGSTCSFLFTVKKGKAVSQSRWNRKGMACSEVEAVFYPEDGELELKITQFHITCPPVSERTYEQNRRETEASYEEFKHGFSFGRPEYTEAAEAACYISWSSFVKPEGYAKYPIMLVNKLYMNFDWTWDYTFNALSICAAHPEAAWDQFRAVAAVQDEEGAFPDCFHAVKMIRSFVKPPVQGFMISKMLECSTPSLDTLELMYRSTAKWTNWWFQTRNGENGIPEYHHGNESGWDNSTAFSKGVPVQSPDLCTWLILQTDLLSRLAVKLNRKEEAERWNLCGTHLLNQMLEVFFQDNEFYAIKTPENSRVVCKSLLLFIPLLLGDRLPEQLRTSMLSTLLQEGEFLTPYGPASESLSSPLFEEDGYWRGAVWPPLVYIMAEALKKNGMEHEARDMAENYCKMCVRSGFRENYSALNGKGLRGKAFTWASSVFLIFLKEFFSDENAVLDS